MTTIIRAADAAQFLTLVPRLAGFTPTRSVVLVPFRGSRTAGVMRADLPGAGADIDAAAATLVGLVCKVSDVDGVALVVYTDGAFDDEGRAPRRAFVEALIAKAHACGLHVADALCVAADGWGSYLEDRPRRRPLADIVAAGIPDFPDGLPDVSGDQGSGTDLPSVDLARSERVARALMSLGHAVDAVCGATGTEDAARVDLSALDPQALAAACALEDVPALFEDALDWNAAELRPFDAATLTWCFDRPALRDIALVQWCSSIAVGDAALAAQLRWEGGADYPEHLASRLWGDGTRPDAGRLAHALDLARHVSAVAPRLRRPGALAAAAWLAWALGRSTHASHYADLALEIDAEHGLAGIVRTMVTAGHLPEWAFDRPIPQSAA